MSLYSHLALSAAHVATLDLCMQGLIDHYTSGGWSCINAFIGLNTTRVSLSADLIVAVSLCGRLCFVGGYAHC